MMAEGTRGWVCSDCGDEYYYIEEMVFDDDESKEVSEKYPDWSKSTCTGCFEAARENRAMAAQHRKAEEAKDMACDYCDKAICIEDQDVIFVNGNAAHGTCAVKAGDVN